jgi:hypothetical protein
MLKALRLLLPLLVLAGAGPALAFQTAEELNRFYRDFAAGSPDAVTWERLAEFDLSVVSKGPGMTEFTQSYPAALQAFDGRKVALLGFMFPLEGGETHAHFLLSAYPPGCPFCLPAGPRELVEVTCDKPIAYTKEAVLLEGTFVLLRDDPSGLYYRLNDARPRPR